jgi:hypothetical protein
MHAELLAAIPGLGTGIFSLTKEQLLLLWSSKETILAFTELYARRANTQLTADKVESLTLRTTGDAAQAASAKCNYYHQNYTPSY